MYCTECGRGHDETARVCERCGAALLAPAPPTDAGAEIPSHLGAAILATLCCCVPLGIPAIVYAASVGTRLAAGDEIGARAASERARRWTWIAFAGGIGFWAVYFVVGLVLGALGEAG